MECWLERYHRAISEDWVVRPGLRTLREVLVESPGFLLQCKAAFPYFRLVDVVTTYLYHPMSCPPRCLPEDCPRHAQGGWRHMSWRRCQHPDGWHLLWNEHSEEHFFLHKPPVQWTRAGRRFAKLRSVSTGLTVTKATADGAARIALVQKSVGLLLQKSG